MKKRLDLYLAEIGKAPSRTKAQALIRSGAVFVNEAVNTDVKTMVTINDRVEIQANEELKYVSRGGLKLEGALARLNIEVAGTNALDIGISTGGFTDCLLQKGAKKVVGVDVGKNQLHAKLKDDPRITSLEKVNARELSTHPELKGRHPPTGWDLVVIDVSFISLTLILPEVAKIVFDHTMIVTLVKPQFEAGAQALNKQGIIKDPDIYPQIQEKLMTAAKNCGFEVLDYFESPIEGKDGNLEFFMALRKRAT